MTNQNKIAPGALAMLLCFAASAPLAYSQDAPSATTQQPSDLKPSAANLTKSSGIKLPSQDAPNVITQQPSDLKPSAVNLTKSSAIKLPYYGKASQTENFTETDSPLPDDSPVAYKKDSSPDESYEKHSAKHTAAMVSLAAAALATAIVMPMLQQNLIHTKAPQQAKDGPVTTAGINQAE
jgi:hypothetical protein